MSEEVKNEFKIITGPTNVILVAPHGYIKKPRDDENTAQLTRLLAKKLNCYAVINEIYKRTKYDPKNKEWPNGREPIDPTIPKVDLNFIPQIKEASLEEKWLGTIKGLKQDILKKHAHCFVFLIHGAEDKNVKEVDEKADVLLGVGRVKADSGKKDRPTATNETIKQLIRLLKDEGSNITAVVAKAAKTDSDDIGNTYAGHSNYNLNQLFTDRNKEYADNSVESIQLEFKKTGFREEKNYKDTAEKLALAISKLAGIEIQLPENMEQPAEAQLLLTHTTEKPDEDLIEEAYSKLAGIFFSHYQNAMLEAGQYIIEKFYNDDIELARQKKPIKKETYTQLVERLQQQREDSPKKSWLFNAVNLVIQEYDFKSVQALGQLKTTHKLLLLTEHNPDKKQKFAEEAVEKGYTTRQLAEAIKNAKKQRKKTIKSYLTKPEELFSSEHSHFYSRVALAEMKPKQLETMKETIKKQAGKIRAEISERHRYVEQYEALIEAVENVGQDNGEEPPKDGR